VPPPLCEAIWVAAENGDAKVIEPLTHLLAGAVARDPSRPVPAPVAIYTLGGTNPLLCWDVNNNTFTPTAPGTPITHAKLCRALADFVGAGPNTHLYLFLVNPAHPRTPPLGATEMFDRIVYLTRSLPPSVPPDFITALPPGTFPRSRNVPLFSAVIPSILVQASRGFSLTASLLAALTPGGTPDFGVREVVDDDPAAASLLPFSEDTVLSRDACNLRFDLPTITADWTTWGGPNTNQPTAFLSAVNASHARTAEAWGRAVTNRRVGLAVSGGGASSYRAGPLLKEFENQKVPIDAFAGLSGGALVGAYYCCQERAGFDLFVWLGPFFSLTLPIVIFTSWPLAFVTDIMLRGERIESLERRLVPVTTGLPPGDPPFAAVVVTGSVGDGVRASGCLPPAFAPTAQGRVRFTDGASTALVPLRILRDYGGADVALVCDIDPGPKQSNPLDGSFLGQLLHDYTPVGRLLDLWSTLAFFSQRATRSFGATADAYVQFEPELIPLLESVMFVCAKRIVKRAEKSHATLAAKVTQLQTAWHNLR
jgi:predicted acylesterase/phospholipase RssA